MIVIEEHLRYNKIEKIGGNKMYKVLIEDMNAALINSVIGSFIIGFIIMLYQFRIGFIITLLLTLISVIRYMARRHKSIVKLEKTIDTIINDHPYVNLDIHSESQYKKLNAKINKLAALVTSYRMDRIENKKSMQSILNDISSQLTRPIEIINEMVDNGSLTNVNQGTLLQIQKLKNLADSMARLVKLETNSETFVLKDLRVDDLIRESIDSVKASLESSELKLIYHPSESVGLFDNEKSKEVLMHVLNNKLRYAKSKIFIDLQENPLSVYVKIYDDGVSIDGEVRHRIFDKFYSNNNDREESLGIGLAIAKEIMNQQNGDLDLEGDNTFVIRFNKKIKG